MKASLQRQDLRESLAFVSVSSSRIRQLAEGIQVYIVFPLWTFNFIDYPWYTITMKLSDLSKHHAVLIVDNEREAVSLSLWNELQSLSPAHRFFNQTVLDIDTARKIISWANTPYNEEKIALISFHTSGIPAQNSMLKILEEPREGVRFILVTSNKDNLIPTVISRLLEVTSRKSKVHKVESEFLIPVKVFLETQPTVRMKLPLVIELLSRVDEEDRKDKESVRNFILQIVDYLGKQFIDGRIIKSKYIEETLQMASYASDPSVSVKALLEYLALLLPQIKN